MRNTGGRREQRGSSIVFTCGGGRCTAVPMELGEAAGDSLAVTLFGPGLRGAGTTAATLAGMAEDRVPAMVLVLYENVEWSRSP